MAKSIDPDIQLLGALADPERMKIMRELAGSSEVCACDFTECCDVSQPTISHHLKVLREAGAVTSERRGNQIYYQIAPNLMDRLGGIARGLVPGGLITVSTRSRRLPVIEASTATQLSRWPASLAREQLVADPSPQSRLSRAETPPVAPSSVPVAAAGSSKRQCSCSVAPGKYGHASRDSSHTVIARSKD